MACVVKGEKRGRPGRWLVDYRDAAGVRRWITCDTKREAEAVRDEVAREARQPTRPVVDSNITVTAYAEQRWLPLIATMVKPRTRESYGQALRLHILPALGTSKLRLLHKGRIKSLPVEKLREGKIKRITEGGITKEAREPLARDSVRITHATIRALLNAALDDGVIVANPAEKLGRALRLVANAKARQEEIKAMSREQVSAFLKAAWTATDPYVRRHYVLCLLMARTGMRLNEALARQWEDVDFEGHEIRVASAFSAGRIGTPKSGHGRTVGVAPVRWTVNCFRDRHRTLSEGGTEIAPPVSIVDPEGTVRSLVSRDRS